LNQGLDYLTPKEARSMETYVVVDDGKISPEVSLIGVGL